ncbi:MAG: carboxypeptidase-like regulatory domain-containing protein [Cyanobacteria bacterium J06638_28]
MVGGLSLPAIALAHGVLIQARNAPAVLIEAAYDSGEPMVNAQVQVYAPNDPQTPIFTGVTDAVGRYTFTPDQPGNWEVSVRQAGHGDITVVPVAADNTITQDFTNSTELTGVQRFITAGAVIWGCIGTALYFRRGKR